MKVGDKVQTKVDVNNAPAGTKGVIVAVYPQPRPWAVVRFSEKAIQSVEQHLLEPVKK